MAAAGHLMGQLALAPSTAALLWAARPALVLLTPRLCVVPACFSTVGAPTLAAVLTPPPPSPLLSPAGFGTILSTAFIHMLLPAVQNLSSPCLPESWNERYEAWAYLFVVLSIVFMQVRLGLRARWRAVAAAARPSRAPGRRACDAARCLCAGQAGIHTYGASVHPHVWCFCASGLLCGPCVAPAALGASAQQAALAWPAARGRRLANRPWPSPAPPLAPPCCS